MLTELHECAAITGCWDSLSKRQVNRLRVVSDPVVLSGIPGVCLCSLALCALRGRKSSMTAWWYMLNKGGELGQPSLGQRIHGANGPDADAICDSVHAIVSGHPCFPRKWESPCLWTVNLRVAHVSMTWNVLRKSHVLILEIRFPGIRSKTFARSKLKPLYS